MTGDRKLTEEEIQLFIQEETLFLDTVNEVGGKPSLYDTLFIEVSAKLDAHSNLIIMLGKTIRLLEEEIQELKNR